MKIISPAFGHNQEVPSIYTCDGENVNPPVTFSDIPKEAKSLVLIVDDPDAVSKKPWIHWVVFNIDPTTLEIAENSVPSGAIEGITDFGKPGWGGPCPPSGAHRYFFKLYALDTTLHLLDGAKKEEVEEAMNNHILSSAELIGVYKRK